MKIDAHIKLFRPATDDFFAMDNIAPVWAGEMQGARGMQQETTTQALDALETTLAALAAAFGADHASVSLMQSGDDSYDLYRNYEWAVGVGFDESRDDILAVLAGLEGYARLRAEGGQR